MSKVYFADIRAETANQSKVKKTEKLFEKADFSDQLSAGELTAIKIHFGEKGGDAFIRPSFVRKIVDKIKENKAKPFLTDTNTLYSGERHNAVDHIQTAVEHGFSYGTMQAPIVIADGLKGQHDFLDIKINKKHFEEVKIASSIFSADSMVVMSHFKGHEMAGFGGAIKNLAMGCAPPAGKKDQHDVKMEVDQAQCTGCKTCIKQCPNDAIKLKEGKAHIDTKKCIGCGECVTVCPEDAISIAGMDEAEKKEKAQFNEHLAEYALGAIKDKQKKTFYINYLIDITPLCDCTPWSDVPVVSDIGILASKDPVALDQACLDLVNKQDPKDDSALPSDSNEDIFKALHPKTKPKAQLEHGEEIGLGTTDYKLIEI